MTDTGLEPEGAEIIPILNDVGSVGKSATVHAVASILAEQGKSVLVADADSQANVTEHLGIEDPKWTIGDVMLGKVTPGDAAVESNLTNVWVIPSASSVKSDIVMMRHNLGSELKMKRALHELTHLVDVILIDCPGTLDDMGIAALVAAKSRFKDGPAWALTCVQPTKKEIVGVPKLEEIIFQVVDNYNPNLQLGGIVPCIVPADNQGQLYKDALALLRASYGDLVTPPVRRSVKIPEAYSRQIPMIVHAPTEPTTKDLRAVVENLQARNILPK